MIRKALLIVILSLGMSNHLQAQYYNQGQDPFSTRWRQAKTDRYRIIYPEENGTDARRVSTVIDTTYSALHFGFSRQARPLPLILHSRNLSSNGVVTWAPRRSELILTPPTETYATPWLKQLTIHEYRHVIQMSNLDRGFLHFLSYLGGEQVIGASAAFIPQWFLEGDAVLAETEMSAYGRALQPEFTLTYRALLDGADADRFMLDKWFCGSYKDFIPNHYNLGYQLTNWSYRQYGPEFWEKIFDYTARRPYFALPRQIAANRFFNTSTKKMFRGAFGELKALWDSLPDVEDSADPIETPSTSYTLYSYPVPVNDTLVVALKYDLDRPNRWVAVNPETNVETLLAYTGNISSRPVYAGGEIFWTEYRPSLFWEQENSSVIRRMNLDGTGRTTTVSHPDKASYFYITPYETAFAAVSYDPVEKYSVVFLSPDLTPYKKIRLPDTVTVHGLAYDSPTGTLALIVLAEEGMNLMQLDSETGTLQPITAPSFVTINHLTAGNGKLFFNSIRSGKDESHYFDLLTRKEYRITTSRYGSVMPAAVPESGQVVQATYRREGYFLSTQTLDPATDEEIPYAELPVNLVNADRYQWNLPVVDTMQFFDTGEAAPEPSKRYRKLTRLFGVHSWAPVSVELFDLIDERSLDLKFGATVISQNTLSNSEGFLTYGRTDGDNWWKATWRLKVFAPKIELSAEYDGGDQLVYAPAGTDPQQIPMPSGKLKKYLSLDGRIYLPFNLSSGRMLRSLTPSVRLTHYNSLIYRPADQSYGKGFEKGEITLSYAQNVRMAFRDLAPRWGFGVQASWVGAPFNSSFGQVYSLYGNLYLPGLALHHSLRLRGAVQYQDAGTYNFANNVLFPKGVDYNFAPEKLGVVMGNYRLPIAYPDWGISQVLYIRRISANLFGGYSRYRPITPLPDYFWQDAYSYGAEISLDTNPLMSKAGFEFRISLYKTSDKKGLSTGFGVSVAL